MTVVQVFFVLHSMNKILKKWKQVMALRFFRLVLKKYGKWFLKICGNPAFAMPRTLLTFQEFMAS